MKKIILPLFLSVFFLIYFISSCERASLDNNEHNETGTFTDPRDNKTYKWVKIGNQVSMAENLAYTGPDIQHITDSVQWHNNDDYDGWYYYNNDPALGQKYGPLYQWNAAKRAVPPGWHLPTNAEWDTLFDYLRDNNYGINGGAGIAISMAKRDDWQHFNGGYGVIGSDDFPDLENKSGFSALPAGIVKGDSCQYLHQATFWWSDREDTHYPIIAGYGLRYDWFSRLILPFLKTDGLSVRCIKDSI